MEFKLINHGDGIGGFQNVQEVLRQEIADTDGTHGPFIIEPFECLPAFRYQRLPICAGEGQGPELMLCQVIGSPLAAGQ